MTIATTIAANEYVGNGSIAQFEFTFVAYDSNHVKVDIDGSTLSSGFTVSRNSNNVGGTVTLDSAPASGVEVIVRRDLPVTQELDLVRYGRFPAENIERALDEGVMIDQQLDYHAKNRVLNLSGGANTMEQDLDMGGFKVINSGPAVNGTDLVTLEQAKEVASVAKGAQFVQEEQPIAGMVQGSEWYIPSKCETYVYFMQPSGDAYWVNEDSVGDDLSYEAIGDGEGGNLRTDIDAAKTASGTSNSLGGSVQDFINEVSVYTEKNVDMPTLIDYQLRNLEYGGLNLNGEESLSILGDSISWGQGSVDIKNDSWVGILTKSANYEYLGEYAGFIPLVVGASDSWPHQIQVTGAWSSLNGVNATHIMNGFARTTTSSTAKMNITVPVSTSPKCDIWWTRQPSGGTFDIHLNGSLYVTANTAGGTIKAGWFASKGIPLNDNGNGECEVSIRPNGDGPVEICGISYGNSTNEFRVQNWSMPGRKARDLSKEVIDRATNGAKTLILALGHNDQNSTGADLTTALENFDYIKEACENFGTKLVVVDFVWDKDYTNPIKSKLRDIGENTLGATYIEFSKSLNTARTLQTASELIDNGFLVDSSHPSQGGHKTIAEAVMKRLQFGVSCKGALDRLDVANSSANTVTDFPLTVVGATVSSYVASYLVTGETVHLVVRFRATSFTDDVILTLPAEISPSTKYYTGSGVEGQLMNAGLVSIGGTGITPALAQFTSATTMRVRNTSTLNDNSDVHLAITYIKG